MLSCAVVAHPDRLIAATELAATVHGVLALDDNGIGAGANHARAWEFTTALESEWALVLEDDAEPVTGFMNQAEQALAAAPEPVVSLYLGRTRPVRWQTERIAPAVAVADQQGAHWIASTHVLHAVAVAIHADLRADWLDFAAANTLPPDERLTAWCISRGHRVAYSHPSLVDHADGPTLVRHTRTGTATGPRRAWRTGTREHWTPKAVPM